MKRIFALILVLLFTGFSAISQKKEEKAVRKAFEDYKSSILNDKGSEAVNYVDSRTIKYYGDIAELVRSADSTKIQTLNVFDKLMILLIRVKASKEDILAFNGKSLLEYAINNGMVGKSSVANNSIGEVVINDNFAKGQFVANGQKAPFDFHFYKEEDQWKIDLTSIFAISIEAFKKMIEESGLGENEFLLMVLEKATGAKAPANIWQAVR